MVTLLLFGKISDDPYYKYCDRKVIEKKFNEEGFGHFTVYNLARTLFQIGTELETGSLKELELKSLNLIIKYANNFILIVGLENAKQNQKNKLEIKGALDEIHQICSRAFESNQAKLIEEIMKALPSLKKEIKSLEPWI